MKPKLIQVPGSEKNSFRVSTEEVPFFYNPFHYHRELEITYVLKSYGTRFIGDHVEPFGVDDLVIVGENLPHCWKNDPAFFKPSSKRIAQAIVVQFVTDFFGKVLEVVEFQSINKMIQDAKKGIKFTGSAKKRIKHKLDEIVGTTGSKRVIQLMELLDLMASVDEKVILNPSFVTNSEKKLNRLNDVYEYSIKHINQRISLEEISAIANLSPNAFCRYFKQHTRKSYTDFLNDLRLSKVCQMMLESELNISEIAYTNGFHNLAHFTKTFRKKKGMNPLEYKKQIRSTMFK